MGFRTSRIERTATGQFMATPEDLLTGITNTKCGMLFSYENEMPIFIQGLAERAQQFGRTACGAEDCVLTCSAIDLTDTVTPVSNIDATIIARCASPESSTNAPEMTAAFVENSMTSQP